MDEQRYKLKREISMRIKILHLIFIGVVTYFLIHTILFIFLNEEIEQKFQNHHKEFLLDSVEITAQRGTIYSRNRDVLATSITRAAVYVDFACEKFQKMGLEKYQEQAKILAQTLADCLGDKSAGEYYKSLIEYNQKSLEYKNKQDTIKVRKWVFFKRDSIRLKHYAEIKKGARRYQRVFRDLDANEWEIIKMSPLLRGHTHQVEYYDYRVYPQGDFARRTIGRNHRNYGIEGAYQETLAGRNGRQRVQRITNNLKIRVEDSINVEVKNGYDIVTTLDVNIQDVAHHALSEQLMKENAIWGTTVVMECSTGDILAMANLKNMGTHCAEVQNYAIGIPVNPGSTFKLVSTMALLENGVPTSKKYHTGLGSKVKIGNNTDAHVEDSHPIGEDTEGVIDMRTAFAESSNVYFTKAIYDTFNHNPIEFSNFCNKLHLGETVGLEEFGATSKPVAELNRKHTSRYNALVNMAYGYAIEVTPLHTLAIYNAVANNGRMVAPRLILRTERDGEVISEMPVKVIEEQICSPQTVRTLRSFLTDVSRVGTAKNYFGDKVCPFRSCSKTGTAQVESEINQEKHKRGDGYYYGSMVTFFPAENPRYTIITAIFTKYQYGKQYYGAGLTGPVQKRVATYLYNRNHNYAQKVSSTRYVASDIKGGNIEKIQTVASEHNVPITLSANEGWGASSRIESGKGIRISPLNIDESVVPNVVGMGLNDALFLLERCGLHVKVVGHGKVVSQSIAPQTLISDYQKRITIRLE